MIITGNECRNCTCRRVCRTMLIGGDFVRAIVESLELKSEETALEVGKSFGDFIAALLPRYCSYYHKDAGLVTAANNGEGPSA